MHCYSSLQAGKVLEPAPLRSASTHRPPKKGFCARFGSGHPDHPQGRGIADAAAAPATSSARRCRQRPAGPGRALPPEPLGRHGEAAAPATSPEKAAGRAGRAPPRPSRHRGLHPRQRGGKGAAPRPRPGPAPGRAPRGGSGGLRPAPQHGHSPRAGRRAGRSGPAPAPWMERERCGGDARRGCSERMRAELNATLYCEGSGGDGGRYLKGCGGPEAAASWRGRGAGQSRLLLPRGRRTAPARPPRAPRPPRGWRMAAGQLGPARPGPAWAAEGPQGPRARLGAAGLGR